MQMTTFRARMGRFNSRIGRDRVIGLCLISILFFPCVSHADALPADLILHSGNILTVNENFEIVEALAVDEGKIIGIGSNAEIEIFSGPNTTRMDLKGKTVIPGLIDSHVHPTASGMHVVWPDLSGARKIADITKAIELKAQSSKPGQWITNSRLWNEEFLAERRSPMLSDLDPVTPQNPVFLNRVYLGVVNSVAFGELGVTKDTPDPDGGRFEKDPETGELTGRVFGAAIDLFRSKIPAANLDQLMAAQKQSFKEMAGAGVTSVRTAGLGTGGASIAAGADELRAYLKLKLRGELILRTSVTIQIDPNQSVSQLERFFRESPVASGFGDAMLNIWGIKMVSDGGSDLAYLRKDYNNRPGYRGQLSGTFEGFLAAARLCSQYGWRLGIHALGDAAIDFVLDVYDVVNSENSIAGKRWAIEHGYFLQADHYPRIQKLGLIWHSQTRHMSALYRNFIKHYPEEYPQMTHPYRTLLDHGILLSGGTDWHIEKPSDMFTHMWTSISRETATGEVVAPDQGLTREEALKMFTIWAAHSTFEEDVKGSLEAGKYADLVVLSENYMSVPLKEITDITPILTMVGGKVIFQKEGAHVAVAVDN